MGDKNIAECLCNIYTIACTVFRCSFVHNSFYHMHTCLLCVWCSLCAISSHRAVLFSNIWCYAVEVLTACSCMHEDAPSKFHYYYHSSIVCGSTSRDSTQTTLKGCVLPCNYIEYYVIAIITPMGPVQPPPIICLHLSIALVVVWWSYGLV